MDYQQHDDVVDDGEDMVDDELQLKTMSTRRNGGGGSTTGSGSGWWGRCTGGKRSIVGVVGVILVVLLVVVGVVVGVVLHRRHDHDHDHGNGGASSSFASCAVMCMGPVLQAVQVGKVFNDSKTFVDMPLKADPDDILAEFARRGLGDTSSRADLAAFVSEFFEPAGSDMEVWTPPDWTPNPPVLNRLASNHTLANWAKDINALWKILGRKVSARVGKNPQRHTLLPLPHPVVVPGGRFRESYYWDTYWIVKGLLRSGMQSTAANMARNLAAMVTSPSLGRTNGVPAGFVPNGARAYYLTRSQPPLLSHMVADVYDALMEDTSSTAGAAGAASAAGAATTAGAFLSDVLPALTAEYKYWMNASSPGGRAVEVTDPSTGHTHVLNRYVADSFTPRPESFLEDWTTVSDAGLDPTSSASCSVYNEIAGMAATGWDFSSRWLADGVSLARARTTDILPVELNAVS